jgi:hypothetical protein
MYQALSAVVHHCALKPGDATAEAVLAILMEEFHVAAEES